jgi:chromate reductase
VRVLGISGSLRRDSHNTRLLRAAAQLAPPSVEFDIYDRLKAIPPYDADHDDPGNLPAPVRDLRERIAASDAVLIATPEYNSSIPGVLKNAIDWASRPAGDSVLRNVPVAVIGASTGQFGAVWAQAELRKVLGSLGGRVVGDDLPVAHAHTVFVGHRPADPHLAEQLDERCRRLCAEAGARVPAAA